MKQVIIYTDGACRGNPGPGGWGALIKFESAEKEIFGGQPDTTNNQMELSAAIEGLAALKEPCSVELFTDSKYVMTYLESVKSSTLQGSFKAAKPSIAAESSIWLLVVSG